MVWPASILMKHFMGSLGIPGPGIETSSLRTPVERASEASHSWTGSFTPHSVLCRYFFPSRSPLGANFGSSQNSTVAFGPSLFCDNDNDHRSLPDKFREYRLFLKKQSFPTCSGHPRGTSIVTLLIGTHIQISDWIH